MYFDDISFHSEPGATISHPRSKNRQMSITTKRIQSDVFINTFPQRREK